MSRGIWLNYDCPVCGEDGAFFAEEEDILTCPDCGGPACRRMGMPALVGVKPTYPYQSSFDGRTIETNAGLRRWLAQNPGVEISSPEDRREMDSIRPYKFDDFARRQGYADWKDLQKRRREKRYSEKEMEDRRVESARRREAAEVLRSASRGQ